MRHKWTYPNQGMPRETKPATCARCGAKHFYRARRKKRPGASRLYGPTTEEFVFVDTTGEKTSNPCPVPSCVPAARGRLRSAP